MPTVDLDATVRGAVTRRLDVPPERLTVQTPLEDLGLDEETGLAVLARRRGRPRRPLPGRLPRGAAHLRGPDQRRPPRHRRLNPPPPSRSTVPRRIGRTAGGHPTVASSPNRADISCTGSGGCGGRVDPAQRVEHRLARVRRPERRQRRPQEAAVARRRQPRVEHRDDTAVPGAAHQSPDALSQPQRRVGGSHGHEPVAARCAPPPAAARPSSGSSGRGNGMRSMTTSWQRRPGHVDALPERERAEQAGAARRARSPGPASASVLALAAARARRAARAAPPRRTRPPAASENSPSVRPPAASHQRGRARRVPPARCCRGRAAAGAARRRGCPAAGSRTGCRRRAPATPARPRPAGPRTRARPRRRRRALSVAEVRTTVRSS